jgi:hypothetical protein
MKEASATPSQAVTVRSLLIGWANEQDAWVRHLVSEVVVSRKPITDGQLDAIYRTFLLEKALDSGDPVNVMQTQFQRRVHSLLKSNLSNSTTPAELRLHSSRTPDPLDGSRFELRSLGRLRTPNRIFYIARVLGSPIESDKIQSKAPRI